MWDREKDERFIQHKMTNTRTDAHTCDVINIVNEC